MHIKIADSYKKIFLLPRCLQPAATPATKADFFIFLILNAMRLKVKVYIYVRVVATARYQQNFSVSEVTAAIGIN